MFFTMSLKNMGGLDQAWTDGTLGNPTYNFHRNWGHAEHVLVLPWNPSPILVKGIAKSQFSFPLGPVVWEPISGNPDLNINLGQFVFVQKHFRR